MATMAVSTTTTKLKEPNWCTWHSLQLFSLWNFKHVDLFVYQRHQHRPSGESSASGSQAAKPRPSPKGLSLGRWPPKARGVKMFPGGIYCIFLIPFLIIFKLLCFNTKCNNCALSSDCVEIATPFQMGGGGVYWLAWAGWNLQPKLQHW